MDGEDRRERGGVPGAVWKELFGGLDMELYFYCLADSKVIFESREVKEKPRTYRPINNFPYWLNRSFVRKEEIGEITGYSKNIVILTEKDDKRAYSVFASHVRRKIEKNKDIIRSIEINNESLRRTLQILELS